ncbi:LEA type 2 family protein [Thiofilum flexile]|uniref:LEA type 2 family protein n=1 Tax=Thiofilum flexile TaxID=125627 RepID=UPI0003763809|nr:LEA type 2 family protein [Thiofilum flexile]
MSRLWAWSLIGVLSLVLQGCASVPGVLEQPKISVQDASLQSVSLTQGNAVIAIQITNPNAFPLPIRGVGYGLNLNQVRVAQGQQQLAQSIAPHSTIPLNIPIQLQFVEIARLIPRLISERKVQYDLVGEVQLPLISIPFQKQGGIGVTP